jgi:hypothetical protein
MSDKDYFLHIIPPYINDPQPKPARQIPICRVGKPINNDILTGKPW